MFDDTAAEQLQLGNVDGERFSRREQLAVRYADAMHGPAKHPGDRLLGDLLEEFSAAEFLELAMTVAQFISMGQLVHLLGIPNPTVIPFGDV